MFELLYTFIPLFGIFIILFFILPSFQIVKQIIIFSQIIICFIFFSNNFYKNHILWNDNYYAFVHKLNFSPIINFYLSNDTLIVENLEDYNYSIISSENYYFKCRDHFFINSSICPITHIIIENKRNNEYSNYTELKISKNKYLYFTREIKYEELYENSLEPNDLNFKSINFNSKENYEKYISNDTKIFNIFKDFKGYTQYIDYICFSLLLFSFLYTFFESYDSLIFNSFKIVNTLIQITILILYLFRYLKFRKIKNILLYNTYENNYLPHKFFNLDSFAIVMAINLLFINYVFLWIPNKCHILNLNNCELSKEWFKKYGAFFSSGINNEKEKYFLYSVFFFQF